MSDKYHSNPEQILFDMAAFCQSMTNVLKHQNLLEHAVEVDHACYRVSSEVKYEQLKMTLASFGVLLTESVVNGRPIATYKLHLPITIDELYSVQILELPAPKPGRPYQDGFEHIEVVVGEPLENFMERYPEIVFEKSNLHATRNRDVAIKFDRRLVKFHETSLENIIAMEQSSKDLNIGN